MILLKRMTGASLEARFLLLVWATHLELKADTKITEVIAAMGMSKRYLPGALEYLVRERFIWKVKAPRNRTLGKTSVGGFEYFLTPECFELFQATLDKASWPGEILYLLNSSNITGSDKSKTIKWQMRLVWVWLVTQSNSAGFFIGFDHHTASDVLGMPVSKVLESFNALIKNKYVTQLSSKVSRTQLFDELPALYKIYPARSDKKIIKLAFSMPEYDFKWLRLLRETSDYHKKASKRSDPHVFPKQDSGLSDADYYALSAILTNYDDIEALEWRAMLTIFKLIPEYLSFVKSGDEDSFEKNSKFLWEKTCEVLTELLPESPPQDQQLETFDATSSHPDKTIQFSLLWEYSLRSLIEELSGKIQRLSTQWLCYRKIHPDLDVQLVGYLPNAKIVVWPTDSGEGDGKAKKDQEHTKHHGGLIYSDAFAVLTPVDPEFQSGAIIQGQFVASKPN